MGGKKIKKHTAKSLNAKKQATKNRNGGAAGGKKGKAARLSRKSKFVCKEIGCAAALPSVKNLEEHYEARHRNKNWATVLPMYTA